MEKSYDIDKLYKKYSSFIAKEQPLDFERFHNYSIVHHSTVIEGSSLTENENTILLDKGITPGGKEFEHSVMSKDHYNALLYVINLANSKQKLSVNTIQKISALVMKGTGSHISCIGGDFDSSKGEFRKLTVRAGNTTFMDYKKVPAQVSQLVDDINNNIKIINPNSIREVYDLAFKAHFQLVNIHPFADGNGRVSRLIMNYVQGFHNKPLSFVFKEDKSKYIDALEATRKKNDLNIFLNFMREQSCKYLKQEIEKFKPKRSIRKRGFSFSF